MNKSFAKALTRNDLGLTGSHQGGVLIPKGDKELIAFLPKLDPSEDNPSRWIDCIDTEGKTWKMRYVYYNGKLTGRSTRNEYRITYMTKLFREFSAQEGTSFVMTSTDEDLTYRIHFEQPQQAEKLAKGECDISSPKSVIRLKGWRKVH
ncbi:hypothetical protein N9F36_09085 [Akkermansiaceae bacterium]|nr:hypothetical protein [Akkermansiaceae bacterium]